MVLGRFSEPTRAWFETSFPAPTAAQDQGWKAIAEGGHSLILAPTGSGKTLAAFLWSIDRVMNDPAPAPGTRIVYLSPLRALAVDVEKNLRSPLRGIALAAQRLGLSVREPTVGLRTGDTAADERRRLQRTPPDILITTPESLYLMLTSRARETLATVDTVIVDEIHAVAATKRGSHLAVSLERLDAICGSPPQRIGLSATQRPLEEIARFLGGFESPGRPRPVTVVDAGVRKDLDIEVVVPVDDMARLGEIVENSEDPRLGAPERVSIWPAIHPKVLELIESHQSTIVFVNARRMAERLAARLNELWLEHHEHDAESTSEAGALPLVMAHHGSLSRERRLQIEDDLKSGRLRGLVATSSLELGIDMGAVDLVIQVESPGAVSRGLQRVGRAGHQVGAPSVGKIFPKHRGDLLEATVVVDRMHAGLIEATHYPRNPLDVLAQQIVAMAALDEWPVDELVALVRRAAPYAELTDDVLVSVLDMLSGRYPSEEFGGLTPRIVWDRVAGTIRGRAGAQRLAVTNPGTIPDRGLFGVFLPDGTRVGELDEEMVYESRPGEVFMLGASTWRIEDITFDRVIVTPAPGLPGKMPFWHGDGPGRPAELGRAVGAFTREIRAAPDAVDRLMAQHHLDERAAANLVGYLTDQAEATGAVPDDRTVVVERFRDEIGDWRVCILTPFGASVHAPWALALRRRLGEAWGTDVELMWTDDGIVLRLPEVVDQLAPEELVFDPEDITDAVVAELPSSALFASRFRECAARALLLPRRRPDRRTPLWQQRQRSADLLSVAAHHPTFPILLEATRECLHEVFDITALRSLMADIRSRRVRLVAVDTERASPMAQSLLFSWIAVYMYEGDAPLAERRAAALALDRHLLRELLGDDELRQLLEPAAIADVELELLGLAEGWRARDLDELHDRLRRIGPLLRSEVQLRVVADAPIEAWIHDLVRSRRAIEITIGGEPRLAAAEDAAVLRDALGIAVPVGLPTAFTDPVDEPLALLVARFARTHGPFTTGQCAAWLGLAADPVRVVLDDMVRRGILLWGDFRPDGAEREWCDLEVLRSLRRRSLALLRREIEPVDGETLARFLPAWQGVGARRRGVDAVADVVGQLQGAAIPLSVLEADVLASRVDGYRPADLDQLLSAGEVVWVGAGAIGSSDGRVRLAFRDDAPVLLDPTPADLAAEGPHHDALRARLAQRGSAFWPELVEAVHDAGLPYDDPTVLAALYDLVWAGEVTNDALSPLRSVLDPRKKAGPTRGAVRRTRARHATVVRSGPPSAAGRWGLVAPLLATSFTSEQRTDARARQLLDRYGVLARETALAEGVTGGFAGVYPSLQGLEARGQVRRGYFVGGLGAAQFALPGAVDRLRTFRPDTADPTRSSGSALVLSAVDPAQPYGSVLPWPESTGRPARQTGAHVVLVDGRPIVYLERGGRQVITFPAAASCPGWIDALASLVTSRRVSSLDLHKIDGQPSRESAWADPLRSAGFRDGYRGLVLRSARAG